VHQAKSLEFNGERLGNQLRSNGVQAIEAEPVDAEQFEEQDGVVGLGNLGEAFGEHGERGVDEGEEAFHEGAN